MVAVDRHDIQIPPRRVNRKNADKKLGPRSIDEAAFVSLIEFSWILIGTHRGKLPRLRGRARTSLRSGWTL